jgi:4-hydroxybutyryl-CoA dehydratase/vinylacetyl-CoA-Delta-isomerase
VNLPVIETGDDYRTSLRDGRTIYFNGEPVKDVPTHSRFAVAVNVAADTYDRQRAGRQSGSTDPRYSQAMYPRTAQDLRDQVTRFSDPEVSKDLIWLSTHPSLLGIASAADDLAEALPEYSERMRVFVADCLRRNIRCMPTITDSKGDRSLGPSKQPDPDQYVRVVERTSDGVVIRGAKMHIRGASMLHELLVLPTKRMKPEESQWAIACAVPVNSPGVKILNAGWAIDREQSDYYPFSHERTVPLGFVVFDDVLVPWERVFLCGEAEHSATLVHNYGVWGRITEAGMMAADADLYVGLAMLLAEANGIDRIWHVRDKIAELIINSTLIKAGVEAAIANATPTRQGYLAPAELYTNVAKYHGAVNMTRMMTLLQDLAGGAIITSPMPGDLDSPETSDLVLTYMSGAGAADGEYRTRLMYGARDLIADWFAGHWQVLGLHGAGGPYAHRLVARKSYDVEHAKATARAALGLPDLGRR